MAADEWIAMRRILPEEPAVLMIAATLDMDVDMVLGKLFRVWVWADSRTANGRVTGCNAGVIDGVCRAKGFADAMAAAQWLVLNDDNSATFPRWKKHNRNSSKARQLNADRQARFRARQKASAVTPRNVTRNASNAHTGQDRTVQKRKKGETPLPPSLDTPEFRAAWAAWVTHRTEKRARLTPTATARQLTALAEMGPSRAIAALNHSIQQGWTGVFEPGDGLRIVGSTQPPRPKRDTLADYRREREAKKHDAL